MVLLCHVISQDHVTKGWSNIICRSFSRQVNSLTNLVSHGYCGTVIMVLGCHMISQDHVIKVYVTL